MTIGIYALYWEEQGLIYIGQSVNIEKRRTEHYRNLYINKHSNIKVQQAYNKYGIPATVILQECSIDKLNYYEEFWQKEFNSLNSLDIVQAGIHHASGLSNPRSKYSKLQVIKTYRYCRNPELTSKDISALTRVSLAMVDDIRSGRAHRWLQEKYPFTWSLIVSTRKQRYTNGYEKSKAKLGKEYIFISPTGEEYLVDNFAKFAKEHKLDSSDLSRVASGKYRHTKGWKLK